MTDSGVSIVNSSERYKLLRVKVEEMKKEKKL